MILDSGLIFFATLYVFVKHVNKKTGIGHYDWFCWWGVYYVVYIYM